jgi:hypothetical protein
LIGSKNSFEVVLRTHIAGVRSALRTYRQPSSPAAPVSVFLLCHAGELIEEERRSAWCCTYRRALI